jgi:hypothetical protein
LGKSRCAKLEHSGRSGNIRPDYTRERVAGDSTWIGLAAGVSIGDGGITDGDLAMHHDHRTYLVRVFLFLVGRFGLTGKREATGDETQKK